ncbi:hypothetical protein [Moorena sp. SIO3F7]|nr:hypothetical protein [Moorena sp. SIO3F7]NEO17189.1 hypothetical protein [Moorena sp. SIO3E8]
MRYTDFIPYSLFPVPCSLCDRLPNYNPTIPHPTILHPSDYRHQKQSQT